MLAINPYMNSRPQRGRIMLEGMFPIVKNDLGEVTLC